MSAAALFEAIPAGDLSVVTSLLNADPALASAKNDSGVSAVLMSVYAGKKEIRDLLLSHGAELDLPTAAAVGNLDRVKQIVEKNPASAASFSADGFPVVALSAVFGHLDVARYLAEHGGDINAPATNGSGYNALTGAVAGGHTQMVEWLLKNGANANYRYGPGYSPLLTAAANGHVEIIKLLLAHGADLHATTNDGKSAPALAAERNHSSVVEFLRNANA
jgi:ankyrin repeat protein